MADSGRRAGRATRRIEHLEVSQGDLAGLVAQARPLAESGSGWISLQPVVHEEAHPPPPPGALAHLFSATDLRHEVPLCTWVPGRRSRRGPQPDSLGIQHAGGPKAIATLAERGVALPEGWRSAQDHPRRGVVVVPPPSCPMEDMLGWLLRAGAALSSRPVTGRWLAEVHSVG